MAIARNPDVQYAIAVLKREGANLTIAQAARYPQLSYCAGMGSSDSCSSTTGVSGRKTVGVTSDILLYDFGRTSGLIEAAGSDQSRAQADVEASKEKIATEVTTAYLVILRATRMRGVARDYVASLDKLKTAIELRADSGVSNQADVVRAEVALDAARTNLIAAETDERGTRAKLINLVGRDFGALRSVDAEFARLNRGLNLGALDAHPELISAQRIADSARHQADAEEAARFPRIGVQAYYGTPFDNVRGSGGVMLTLKGDLYRGGAQEARISAAKSSETAARMRIDSIKLTSGNKFGVASQNERGAIDRITIAKRQLANSIITRDLYFEQYTLGKRTLTELLDAESGINSARIGQILADYDRQVAILDRAVAIGAVAKAIIGANLEVAANTGPARAVTQRPTATTQGMTVVKKPNSKSSIQKPASAHVLAYGSPLPAN